MVVDSTGVIVVIVIFGGAADVSVVLVSLH